MIKGKEGNQYRKSVRSFAATLRFYSPRAYNYVRNKFNLHLPHDTTLRKWYANLTFDGRPGISQESLNAIKLMVVEMRNQNEQLYCSLCWDEMSIRRHVQWVNSEKKFKGYISYGRKDPDGKLPVARNALVFLLNGHNTSIAIPVAHHFITTLKADEKAVLVGDVVSAISAVGAKIINVTFDGLSTNLPACEILGASFDLKDMKPYIRNPYDGTNIHVILDASHMVKLLRNYFASRTIYDSDKKKIQFKYIERLESYRIKHNFITHKLTKRHIQWDKAKMNVKLAVQTLSNSVAESMLYLREQGCEDFEDCLPTVNFIKKVNVLFDIFNSDHNHQNNFYKRVLNKDSSSAIFEKLDEIDLYIRSLKFSFNQSVLNSEKKYGFIGFLIDICSLKNIYA